MIGGAGLLTRISRRRRPERKGLEAIFSSQNEARDIEVLAGATSLVTGLLLSILATFRAEDPQALAPWGKAVYSPLTFGSLGVFLLICGVGIIVFALGHHQTRLLSGTTPPINGNSETDILGDREIPNGTRRVFGPAFKISAAAFIQSFVLVALYSGFVQEFESNLGMQNWMRSNFPVGLSLLNWESVSILAISLGLLQLQFLPGGFFSE